MNTTTPNRGIGEISVSVSSKCGAGAVNHIGSKYDISHNLSSQLYLRCALFPMRPAGVP